VFRCQQKDDGMQSLIIQDVMRFAILTPDTRHLKPYLYLAAIDYLLECIQIRLDMKRLCARQVDRLHGAGDIL